MLSFNKQFRESIILGASLLFCSAWIIYMMLKSPVPNDVGDGIMHYFISNASWENPELFLHHWGKPLFILLSSPFAQFGFYGMVIFNLIVFGFTVIIGYKLLRKKGVPVYLQVLLPLILLKAHDIANTILGGMTEPLFNLSLMGALYLLNEKKYFWFALVVSTMPFLRSEGQLPLLLAFVLLLFAKQYKYIPLLASAFLVYGIVGIFVYSDFLWYFNQSPYHMSNNIYGSGSWNHYLLSYKNYLGNPGLYIFILAVPSFFYMLFKRLKIDWNLWIFSYGVFIGILTAHSYFWATGQNGSLGLTRIATQGVPIFLVMNLIAINNVPWSKLIVSKWLGYIFALGIAYALFSTKYYPKKIDALDSKILNTANYLKEQNLGESKVYYHFPLLSFAFGENPFKKHNKLVYYTFTDLDNDLRTTLKPGDLIVRDSHFGPMEMLLPMGKINNHPHLHVIREFVSSEQVNDANDETEGVIVLKYDPSAAKSKNLNSKTVYVDKVLNISENQEFIGLNSLFPLSKQDIEIKIQLKATINGFPLIYDYNNGSKYSLMDLKANEKFNGTFIIHGDGKTKLYIWNPRKLKGKIYIEKIILE
jgi:hypothetical protein